MGMEQKRLAWREHDGIRFVLGGEEDSYHE